MTALVQVLKILNNQTYDSYMIGLTDLDQMSCFQFNM